MRTVKMMAVAALVGLSACAGKDGARMVEVVIGLEGVRSGELSTKADAWDVEEALDKSSVDVTGMQMRLIGNGVNKDVKVGQSVTLLEGEYRIYGGVDMVAVKTLGGHMVGERPGVYADAMVNVEDGMTEIKVPARFICWALALDMSELEKVVWDGEVEDVTNEHGVKVWYVSTTEQGVPWTLRVVPWNTAKYKAVDYQISGNTAGKWYYYSPKGKVDVGGMLGLDLAWWEQGEL